MAEGAADSAAAVGAGDDLDDLWGSFCTEARSSLWHKASPPRHAEGGGSPSRALRELAQFALPHDDLRFQQQLNRDLAAEGAFAAGHATHGGEHPQVDHLELDPLDEPAVIAHGLERGRPLDAALPPAVDSAHASQELASQAEYIAALEQLLEGRASLAGLDGLGAMGAGVGAPARRSGASELSRPPGWPPARSATSARSAAGPTGRGQRGVSAGGGATRAPAAAATPTAFASPAAPGPLPPGEALRMRQEARVLRAKNFALQRQVEEAHLRCRRAEEINAQWRSQHVALRRREREGWERLQQALKKADRLDEATKANSALRDSLRNRSAELERCARRCAELESMCDHLKESLSQAMHQLRPESLDRLTVV